MSTLAGNVVKLSVTANATRAISELNATASAATNMGKKIGGLGSILSKLKVPALAVFGGIGAGAFKAGNDAATLGDSIDAMRIVLGPASGAVEAFGKSAAKNFGISKQTAADASLVIGNIGSHAGLAGKDLEKFTVGLVSRAGDVASMFGGTAKDAVDAFGSALRGEMDPIEKYGVQLNAATLQTAALKLGIIKNIKQALTPSQKSLVIQSEILRQTSKAQGNFADTAGSAKNKQETLKATISNLSSTLGTALLPAMVVVAGWLTKLADNTGPFVSMLAVKLKPQLDWLKDNGPKIFAAISDFLVNDLWPVVQTVFGWLADNVPPVFNAISDVITQKVIPVMRVVVSWIVDTLWPGMVKLAEYLITTFTPTFQALSEFLTGHVIPALKGLWERFQAALPTIITVGEAIGVVIGVLFVIATTILGKVLPVILQLAGPVFGALVDVLGVAFSAIVGVTKVVITIVEWFGNMVSVVAGIPGAVSSAFGSMITWIKAAFSNSISWLTGAFENIAHGAVAGLTSGAAWIWGKLVDIHLMIVSAFDSAASWLIGGAKNVALGIVNGLVAGATWVWGKLVDIHLMIVDAFDTAASWLVGAGRSAVSGLLSGLGSMAGSVGGMIRTVVGWLLSGFATAGEWLIGAGRSAISGLGGGINSMFGALVAIVKKTPSIVLTAIGNAGHILWDTGIAILRGFGGGLWARIGWLMDLVGGLKDAIIKKVKDMFHIGSPSKTMAIYGASLTEGLGQGLLAAVPTLRRQLSRVSDVVTSGLSASPSVALGAGVGRGGTTVINNITVQVPVSSQPEEVARQIDNVLATRAALVGR